MNQMLAAMWERNHNTQKLLERWKTGGGAEGGARGTAMFQQSKRFILCK